MRMTPDLSTWASLFKLSRMGIAKRYLKIGDVIQAPSTYTVGANTYACPWLVMDFRTVETEDGTAYQNVPIIQMQCTTHENCEFDPAEKTEATEETAQDGYYYVGFNGTNYTVLSLSTGATIPYGDYTTVYKTLWNSKNAVQYGLNNWKLSWARQYLNHSGTGWAEKQHSCDVLPSNASNITGFMSYMPQELVSELHPIKVVTKQSNYVGAGTDTTYDRFWLASISEMNMKNGNASVDDGEPWGYYKTLFDSTEKVNTGKHDVMKRYSVSNTTSAQGWWCRSAYLGSMYEWLVSYSGNVDYYRPTYSIRLLPACALV